MKNHLLFPLALLFAVLAFSLWNGTSISNEVSRWQQQLDQSDLLAQAEDWAGAVSVLTFGYEDWSQHQTWLHIVSHHNVIDDAESMYHRAMAFAVTREPSEFRAELADLREQLGLLAETERFSLKNVL